MSGKRLTKEENQRLLDLWQNTDMTQGGIAKEIGCGILAVNTHIKKSGIKKASTENRIKKIIDLYVNQGMSIGGVAKIIGCSYHGVQNPLSRRGLLRHDYRVYKKGEIAISQEKLELIKNMYVDKGMSAPEVAKELGYRNSTSISTYLRKLGVLRSKLEATQRKEFADKISRITTGRKMSDEAKKKISIHHRGLVRSTATKARLRKIGLERWANMTDEAKKLHFSKIFSHKGRTKIEIILNNVLDKIGVEHIQEYPCYGYVADQYLPAYKIVLEADGEYWHNKPGVKARDKVKDFILHKNGIEVVRFSEYELNKKLDQVETHILRVIAHRGFHIDVARGRVCLESSLWS